MDGSIVPKFPSIFLGVKTSGLISSLVNILKKMGILPNMPRVVKSVIFFLMFPLTRERKQPFSILFSSWKSFKVLMRSMIRPFSFK